jgi:hypothetical protein
MPEFVQYGKGKVLPTMVAEQGLVDRDEALAEVGDASKIAIAICRQVHELVRHICSLGLARE